jgi:glycosyltransferase involved in cell wall biosynthesis
VEQHLKRQKPQDQPQFLSSLAPYFMRRCKEVAGMCSRNRRVVVLSGGQWLDSLHGTSALSLFKSLASQSYRVEILSNSHTPRRLENGSFSILALESKKNVPLLTRISLFRRFFEHLIKSKPDVLIFDYMNTPLFLLFRAFVKSKGIMLILSRPLRNWFYFLLFRLFLIIGKLFADAFTAISPFEAMEYSRLGGIPIDKITVIPSTIGENFEKFIPTKNPTEVRLKLGLNTLLKKKVAIYHGVLSEEKGVMKLVQLFSESFKNNDKVALLIVGDGPAKSTIQNYVYRNRIKNIILLGRLSSSKVPEALAASDLGIILHPDDSRWRYQCNIKMIELLFMGKPVLASDLPGLRWIGADSPLVAYLRQSDSYSFKEELTKLISNLEKTAAEVIETRQNMIERFSSKSVAIKLGQLIDSC